MGWALNGTQWPGLQDQVLQSLLDNFSHKTEALNPSDEEMVYLGMERLGYNAFSDTDGMCTGNGSLLLLGTNRPQIYVGKDTCKVFHRALSVVTWGTKYS